MSDSPALAMLKQIRDRSGIEAMDGHGWQQDPEAGWVFTVREGDGWRKLSITVADQGFTSDAEIETLLARST